MHNHHVRQREAEEPIVAHKKPLENAGEISPLLRAKVGYGRRATAGVDVCLVGEVSVERDKGRSLLREEAPAVLVLLGEEVAVQAAILVLRTVSVPPRALSGRGGMKGRRRSGRAGGGGHADGLTLVLEDKDVLHEVHGAEPV